MTMQSEGAVRQYEQIRTHGGVDASDPHQLVLMLMNGALDAIATAKGHMDRGAVPEKGASISRAISIIEGLRVSLDKAAGGDMADNLDELYQYMNRRLVRANLDNEPPLLDEVASLMHDIKSAWEQIPPELRKVTREEGETAQAATG